MTEALLKAGADVAHGTSLGVQPLHMAAQEGQVEVAEILLKHGAPSSSTDKAGWNALHYAANHRWATWKGPISGQLETIRMLVHYGANLNMGDSEGYTCVHSAAQSGKAEILHLLRALGASPDVSTVRGVTPIHVAAEGGRAEAVEALLEWCPALLEVEDVRGHRPIHHAAYHGHADVAEVLVRHGASLGGGHLSVTSPLHLAVRSQRMHILVLLLAAGANPHMLDGHGWTPRNLAEECARRRQAPLEGHHERMRVLELAELGVPLRWSRENHTRYPPAFHGLTREILCAMHPPMRRRDVPGLVADLIADDVLAAAARNAVWPMLDERCWKLVERGMASRQFDGVYHPQHIATAAA